jgi:tetratricopeptide (TPR) repeat protein
MTGPADDATLPGGPGSGDRTVPGGPGAAASDFGTTRPEGRSDPAATSRFGAYRVVRELGRGGQGAVFLAEDERLGRRVALKILSANFAGDPRARTRFEREAAAVARLDHPGVCTVYEAGVVDGAPFIAMRFVDGETLSARIKRRRDAAAPESRSASSGATSGGARRNELFAEAAVVEGAARALHAAHEAGFVHRDVKPQNVMVEPDGAPVVLDFGLARDAGADAANASLTGTEAFLGTPAYMAPEQTLGLRADRRADVWALGATLYETVALTKPFDAPTLEGLLRAIRTQDPADPRKANPACTPELAAVIACALEKDPARRYADAAAFADDVARARRLEPVRAKTAGPLARAGRWIQRNPVVAAAGAVVVASLSVGLAASLSFLRDAEEALSRETQARLRETAARDRAEDLLEFMLGDLKPRLEEIGRVETLGAVARKAADYYASAPPAAHDVAERVRRARALRGVGDVLKAEGDVAAAVLRYGEARALLEALRAEDPSAVLPARELATTEHALAVAAMARGDKDEALARSAASLALREELLARLPDDDEIRVLHVSGVVTRANALQLAGRKDEAEPLHRAAVAGWRSLVAADPAPRRRRELGVALGNLAETLRQRGDVPGAEAFRREAIGVFDALLAAEPDSMEWAEQAATSRHGLGILLLGAQRAEEALEIERAAVAALRTLSERDPLNARRRFQYGSAAHALGVVAATAGRPADALKAHGEAYDARRASVAADPKNRAWRADLQQSASNRSEALAAAGRGAEAVVVADAAVVAARAYVEAFPGTDASVALSRAANNAAALLREEGEVARAADAGALAATTFDGCAASRPVDLGREETARAANWAAVAAAEAGRGADAERFAALSAARADAYAASKSGREAFVWRAFAAMRRAERCGYLELAGRPADARDARKASVAELSALLSERRGVRDVAAALVDVRLGAAAAARTAGRYADAAAELGVLDDDVETFGIDPEQVPALADATRLSAEARRLVELAEGAAAVGAGDMELYAELALRAGRCGEARDVLDRALASTPRRAVAKPGPAELRLRTAAAAAAAAECATARDADLAAAAATAAVSRLSPVVAALRVEADDATARALEEAAAGAVSAATRARRGEALRRLRALRDVDPRFAAVRDRPEFRALF